MMRSALLFLMLIARPLLADSVIARYAFDDGSLPTAQESFFLIENAKGFVDPSVEEKFSGYRSLELKEEPLDGDFVELQAVFEPIESGHVLFHFAFLLKNAGEEFNIALAGPQHFTMRPNGISFWLRNLEGTLFHQSDGMPKRLFKLRENVWYVCDIQLRPQEGTYDLRIVDASAHETVALLRGAKDAVNAPSSITKLSFIGDLDDRSSVHYFVDDIELRELDSAIELASLGTSLAPIPSPVSAEAVPGPQSRALAYVTSALPSTPVRGYLDEFLEFKKLELARPQCLPATSYRDFGIDRGRLKADPDYREALAQLFVPNKDFPWASPPADPVLKGVYLWRQGCLELSAGRAEQARARFSKSLEFLPDAPVVLAGAVAAALSLGNRVEAEHLLFDLYQPWAEDARLPVVLAMTAANWKHYDDVRRALENAAGRLGKDQETQLIGRLLAGDQPEFDKLQSIFGEKWKSELDDLYIGQGYYYALLFSDRFREAVQFSEKMQLRYKKTPAAERFWIELHADALALGGKTDEAKALLLLLVEECSECDTARRKLNELRVRSME